METNFDGLRTNRDHVRRYRRSVSPSKNFSVENEITTQIRHVLSAMIKTFCARDEKLCLQGPKGDTGKRGPIGGPGDKGDKGSQGYRGKRGPAGLSGEKSEPGRHGNKGVKGDTGESVSPPKIASSPTSLTVREYNSASFRCKAEGLPIPVITWYRNGSSLIVRDRHTAQPNNTLLLRNVTFSDHGTYTCVSAILTVQVPVKITQGPKSTAIEEGSDLRLTCTATGQPKPSISWERLGSTLDTKRLIVDGATFILKSSKVSDSGTYSCRAENLINFETASGSVVVVPKLHFTVPPPQNVTIFAGKSLILHCQADSGDFSVVVTWSRSNGPQLTARHRTLANGSLVIEKASLADQASTNCEQFIKYECHYSVLFHGHGQDYGWWMSRDGIQMNYWGGASPGSGKCACGVTRTCALSSRPWNCDSNDKVWREDSGLLTDMSTLPVSELRFGDTCRA